jgi:hypothetical protein
MKIFLAAANGPAVTATNAFAGEQPVDQDLSTPRAFEYAPVVGIGRPILHEVDLTGWRGKGPFYLRMRRLAVAVVGTVPILRKEGASTPEFGLGQKHWWENKSGKAVVSLSTDVVPVEMQEKPMMQMP